MSFRLYIVPVVGTGSTKLDRFRPKYFQSDVNGAGDTPIIAAGAVWDNIDYGFEKWTVVGGDLPSADDLLVVGQPDCFALPNDLGVQLNAAQVTSVQNKLEALNCPAGWVNTSLTWVTVARKVLGMFSFLQRFGGIYAQANQVAAPSLFASGVSLATTFGSLSQAVQNALIATAQSFGFSTAGLSGSTTLRTILKVMADNFGQQQYSFNGTLI